MLSNSVLAGFWSCLLSPSLSPPPAPPHILQTCLLVPVRFVNLHALSTWLQHVPLQCQHHAATTTTLKASMSNEVLAEIDRPSLYSLVHSTFASSSSSSSSALEQQTLAMLQDYVTSKDNGLFFIHGILTTS